MRTPMQVVRQPRCRATPRPWWLIMGTSLALAVVVFFAALTFPSWWLLPVALLLGFMAAVHPICFIMGTKHQHGDYWHREYR